MTKEKNKDQGKNSDKKQEQEEKPWRKAGGTYFYCGSIIGRKNVFVTSEYLDLLANAFKMAEVKKDVKNLAYVIMPNFFYWMFRLSPKQDDPVQIYKDVKGEVAINIMKQLKEESKGEAYKLLDLFKDNERIGRSKPEKIMWTFEEYAKKFKANKRFRVWAPKTELRLMETDEEILQKLKVIQTAPVSERWQIVKKAEDYPYYYLSEELSNQGKQVKLDEDLPVINLEQSVPIEA